MRIARTSRPTFDLRSPEIPAVLCALAFACLHFAVGGIAGYALLVAATMPVVWAAAAAGPRGGFWAALATLVVVADSALTGQLWRVTTELFVLAVLAPMAMYIGLVIRHEDREIEKTQSLVRGRIARLKGEPGLWHEVATSRMGAHVTAVEAAFITQALESRPPGMVLDIGAGSGRLEFAMREHARTVVATDVDTDELSRMEDDPLVAPVGVAPLPSLPVRDDSLDWIVAIEVPAASDELWFPAECQRAVKPGGGIVLMVYNAASYKGLFARLLARWRAARGVRWASLYYQRSLSEHIDRWQSAGFAPVRQTGFYWSPLPRSSNSPLVAAGSASERLLGLRKMTAISPWVLIQLRREG